MGQIIIIRPGDEPRTVQQSGPIRLEFLQRTIGVQTLDARSLGTIPPRGTRLRMWIDDLGLTNPAARPNRRLPPPSGAIVCGTIVLCALVDQDEVGLDAEEVQFLLRNIEHAWEKLGPDTVKPGPRIDGRPTNRLGGPLRQCSPLRQRR